MAAERRFDEDEVREILAIAARRESGVPAPAQAAGLTLRDVQQIAAEAGIPAEHVTAAVREIDARSALPQEQVFGSGVPPELRELRILPAADADAAWPAIVDELRQRFRREGIASAYGNVHEWIAEDRRGESDGTIVVRTERRDDSVALTVRQDVRTVAAVPALLGGSLAGTGALLAAVMAFGSSDPSLLAPALLAGAGAGAWGIGRIAVRHWARRQKERLQAVADRIERLWGEHPPPESGS